MTEVVCGRSQQPPGVDINAGTTTMVESDAATSNTPAAMMSMADPHMSSLQDVQRELDAIKAERRRRQRAMYDAIRPSRHIAKKTTLSASEMFRFTAAARALISVNALGRTEKKESRLPPYSPEVGVPLQILTMAYGPRPCGRLFPCPSHRMGSLVEALDLSPWNMSSIEHTNELWSKNK